MCLMFTYSRGCTILKWKIRVSARFWRKGGKNCQNCCWIQGQRKPSTDIPPRNLPTPRDKNGFAKIPNLWNQGNFPRPQIAKHFEIVFEPQENAKESANAKEKSFPKKIDSQKGHEKTRCEKCEKEKTSGKENKSILLISWGCHVRRMALIRSALESTDPGASNGASNVKIRPLAVDLTTFGIVNLPNNGIFLSTFLQIRNSTTRQSVHFKSNKIGSKRLELDAWPNMWYARVSTFQRTSNQRRTAQWRAWDMLFLKMRAKCVHKMSGKWTRRVRKRYKERKNFERFRETFWKMV